VDHNGGLKTLADLIQPHLFAVDDFGDVVVSEDVKSTIAATPTLARPVSKSSAEEDHAQRRGRDFDLILATATARNLGQSCLVSASGADLVRKRSILRNRPGSEGRILQTVTDWVWVF
jgi:hypothetical protein